MCDSCCIAKSHKLPFASSTTTANNPLEIVHCDVWGPSPVISHTGFRYYVLFTDQYSRFNWIFFCATKSAVATIFEQFKVLVENLLSCTIKTVQTDGGTEFKPIIRSNPGIQFHLSCPYTPQQNGLVERKHRQVVELGLATMFYAAIPSQYWPEVFDSVVFTINRLPSSPLSFSTPYNKLFNKNPDYSMFKVIGCKCYPYTRPYASNKLDPRSVPCVFLGYSTIYKGYKCLDIKTNKTYLSRHVVFDETSFPFKQQESKSSPTSTDTTSSSLTVLKNEFHIPSTSHSSSTTSDSLSHPTTPTKQTPLPIVVNSPTPQPPLPITKVYERRQKLHSAHPIPQHSPLTSSVHSMQTRSKSKALLSNPQALLTTNHSLYHIELDPTTYAQASKLQHWRDAMAKELDALAVNNTWVLVPSSEATNIVGCKWVYKTKRKSDGTVERYKARLVAKGYTQEEGLDYTDTFSPVIKPTTIRLVLSIAVTQQWCIRQLDVNNAFLHGELHEVIHMTQPPGFIDKTNPTHVCRLQKALYGLRQSPRAWYHKLKDMLLAFGFHSSTSDPSLFIFRRTSDIVFLLVYVDDIILTGNNPALLQGIIQMLDINFTIKDLGELHFFLGIEVHPQNNGLLLTQSKYILSILARAHMQDAKPNATPMNTGNNLSKFDGVVFENPQLYRSIVGALQYVTISRPDICFAVNRVSQYMHAPTVCHWAAVKRILRYLNGTIHFGLTIRPSSSLEITAFSDSDWARCPDDRKSTTGYLVFLGSNLISWSSKKQSTVARSSTEAEYRGLATVTAEVIWLQSLFKEFNLHVPVPTLWCDNLGATFLASNPAFHARTKHVELDYHFVRENVATGRIRVKFICSQDQLADALTKPLATARFKDLRFKLTVILYQSA
jgi:Reverse transcriptase (RNA-dependent DNA polymerase)